MNDYRHLKDEIYYSDLYDSITVHDCRITEDAVLNQDLSKHKGTRKDKEHAKYLVHQLSLYYKCALRYMHKPATIAEWIERDRKRDGRVERATAPRGVRCLKCSSSMNSTSKHLDIRDNSERVLFFYECPNDCLPRRAFFEDNEEYTTRPHLCVMCQHEMTSDDKRDGDTITIAYSCNNCEHTEIETLELGKTEAPMDEHYEEDRKRFCFNKEKGDKAVEEYHRLMQMSALVDKWKERETHQEQYEAVAKIKKLPVAEVQKLLHELFTKHGYTDLQFQQPNMERYVIVPFTAIDSKSDRTGKDSEYELRKLINTALDGTNWRLMTDGISYRAGYVSGRIRHYETEEDLLNLIDKTSKKG